MTTDQEINDLMRSRVQDFATETVNMAIEIYGRERSADCGLCLSSYMLLAAVQIAHAHYRDKTLQEILEEATRKILIDEDEGKLPWKAVVLHGLRWE